MTLNKSVTNSCYDLVEQLLTLLENPRVKAALNKINDPVEQYLTLLENPRVQAVHNKIIDARIAQKFDAMLATSDLRPIKRLAELEKVTGIYEFEDWEEHAPTIPEEIKVLSEKIEKIKSNPQACKPSEPINIVPETKTEVRAFDLVRNALSSKKDFLTGKEMDKILQESIEAEKRPKKISNLRMVKKCALLKAEEMFPFLKIDKSINGNHKLRLLITDRKALSDYAIKHGM